MMSVSDYIKKIAEHSKTPQHETIEQCLEYFGVFGTKDLTLSQAEYWWMRLQQEKMHGI